MRYSAVNRVVVRLSVEFGFIDFVGVSKMLLQTAAILAFVTAAHTDQYHGGAICTSDEDCQLNGICLTTERRCECDAGTCVCLC